MAVWSTGYELSDCPTEDFCEWDDTDVSNATLVVSTTSPHRGLRHARADNAGAFATASMTKNTSTVTDEIYLAFRMKVSADLHSGDQLDIVQIYAPAIELVLQWFGAATNYLELSSGLDDDTYDYSFPVGTYTLVEVYLKCHDTAGIIRCWINDSLVLEVTGIDTGTDDITAFKVGMILLADSNDEKIDFDSVVYGATYNGPGPEPGSDDLSSSFTTGIGNVNLSSNVTLPTFDSKSLSSSFDIPAPESENLSSSLTVNAQRFAAPCEDADPDNEFDFTSDVQRVASPRVQGSYAYESTGSVTNCLFEEWDEGCLYTDKLIYLKFWFRLKNLDPTELIGKEEFFLAETACSNGGEIGVYFKRSGNDIILRLEDIMMGQEDDGTTALQSNTWYYIELKAHMDAAATVELLLAAQGESPSVECSVSGDNDDVGTVCDRINIASSGHGYYFDAIGIDHLEANTTGPIGMGGLEQDASKNLSSNFVVRHDWLADWPYRKVHIITGVPNAGSNYQVKIKVHRASGSDSGEDVYLGTNCRSDFADLRFTKGDATELTHFLANVSAAIATFYVRIEDDLEINQPLFIYCGKPNAESASDFEGTFAWSPTGFSDDLSKYKIGDNPNTDDWEREGLNGTNTITIQEDPGDSTKKAIRIVESGDSIPTRLTAILAGVAKPGIQLLFRIRGEDTDWYMAALENGTIRVDIKRDAVGDNFQWHNNTQYNPFSPALSAPANTWMEILDKIDAAGTPYVHRDKDGTDGAGGFRTNPATGVIKYRFEPDPAVAQTLWLGGIGSRNKFIVAKKFSNPEPGHGSWKSENTADNLPSSFNLRMETADLSSSITVQTGDADLSSSFKPVWERTSPYASNLDELEVFEVDSVNLSSNFTVRTPGSKDLSSSFTIRKSGSADLSSSFSIQKSASAAVSSSFTIQKSDSAALSSSFAIQRTDSEALSSSFTTQAVVDLSANFTIQKSDSEALSSSFAIQRSSSEALSSSFTVPTFDSEALSSSFAIQKAASVAVSSSVTIQKSASTALSSSFTLNYAWIDLSCKFSIGGYESAELSTSVTVRNVGSSDLSSSITVRKSASVAVSSSLTVMWPDAEDLSANFTIQKLDSADLSSSITLRKTGSAEVSSSFTIQKVDSQALPSSFTIQESDSADLSSSVTLQKSASAAVSSSFTLIEADSAALSSSFTLNYAWVDLSSSFTPGGADSAALPSSVTIQKTGTVDLSSSVSIQKSATATLSASVTLRKPDSADLSTSVTLQKSTAVDLPASITLQKSGLQDLSASLTIQKFSTEALSSSFTIQTALTVDLSSSVTIQKVGTVDLSSSVTLIKTDTVGLSTSITLPTFASADLSSNFTTLLTYARLSSSFWINRRVKYSELSTTSIVQVTVSAKKR